ncbi:MAG: hypothetical protein HN927_08975 [Candidatus Marinimicrobia bacterium]|jgi:hypothetical protein|nr:hypothetical protein [Candidatus Neomarinimicrobiota bacterium]MBT3947069.1 hypothetical protein [Candidatus Neomarinimicrobiota bacterium]MBT4064428.1 hypothetical protein [Candidatus Neomarinimicrobiota bacterium]MBT4308171.1 hypothetical protein [Candidatus Neomarinimicrobiota bacterium]MBT4454094.1 hypothetical protein [Candidatus Neomarinimicrobiota bacterium]
MNKFILSIIVVGVCFSQDEADTTVTAPVDTTDLVEPDTVQAIIQEEIPKTTEPTANDTLVPLPDVRELGDKTNKLPLGEPFFELKSSIDLLHQQMDSLKRVISVYEKGKGAMPTIDEELLNLIKIPQLRHRIELQNGTIVNGEIIQEDDLGIIVQTSIGQLSIEMDRVVNIVEDLPPNAKVEIMGEPFVNAFPDREEISGVVKNVGLKRADFVRVIAHLWTATTELVQTDSIFVTGKQQKYLTGIRTDTALEPGSTSEFKLTIPLSDEDKVSYRTYEVRWETYK